MKKKILILGGGISKERQISLETAKQVKNALKKKYKVIQVDVTKNFVKNLKSFGPDIVFNALHGRFGEDGYIQRILEFNKVKYTHSGVLSSALAMDKVASKKLFIKNGIQTPKFLVIKNNFQNLIRLKSIIKKKLNFPIVIKPINEGSSVDVFICNDRNLKKNLTKLKRYKEILVEEYIGGREIQAAILGGRKLGIIELKPKRKFYDYKAKYNSNSKTKHIIPVNLTKQNLNKVLNIALKAHKLLKCRGVTRSDFKLFKNKFYLLETNTQPGMTKLSLVPEIAAFKGISFIKLLEWILKDASIKK
jgi:D-alanine-D-alanine ligase